MKNHKGAVPALLTLGLVLVGSLITIGISFLTNNNKISSNPRAAGCSKKTFCAEGKINNDGSGTNYFWTRDGDFFSDQDCGTMMIASQVCTLSDTSVDDDSSEGTLNKSCRSSAPYCNQGLICNSSTICVEDNSCGKLGGNCINGCPSDRLISDSQATNYCVQSFASGFSCCKPYSGGSGDDDDNPPTSSNGVPYPKKACCFKKEGQDPVVYATALARVNNEMSTPCTTEAYNNAYNAEWGYCNDDGSGFGSTGGGGGGGDAGSTPCEKASASNTCVKADKVYTDSGQADAFCKGKNYVGSSNWQCADDKYVCCSSQSTGPRTPPPGCTSTTCSAEFSGMNYSTTVISYNFANKKNYYQNGYCGITGSPPTSYDQTAIMNYCSQYSPNPLDNPTLPLGCNPTTCDKLPIQIQNPIVGKEASYIANGPTSNYYFPDGNCGGDGNKSKAVTTQVLTTYCTVAGQAPPPAQIRCQKIPCSNIKANTGKAVAYPDKQASYFMYPGTNNAYYFADDHCDSNLTENSASNDQLVVYCNQPETVSTGYRSQIVWVGGDCGCFIMETEQCTTAISEQDCNK